VREIVRFCHIFAVLLCGTRELGVASQRALAMGFAFMVDEAQDRFADLFEVAGARGQVGVGARARGVGPDGGAAGARGRGGGDDWRRQKDERGEQGCRDGRLCDMGACHDCCIGPRKREPELWMSTLATFASKRRKSGS
jgi:hypothetical protein